MRELAGLSYHFLKAQLIKIDRIAILPGDQWRIFAYCYLTSCQVAVWRPEKSSRCQLDTYVIHCFFFFKLKHLAMYVCLMQLSKTLFLSDALIQGGFANKTAGILYLAALSCIQFMPNISSFFNCDIRRHNLFDKFNLAMRLLLSERQSSQGPPPPSSMNSTNWWLRGLPGC